MIAYDNLTKALEIYRSLVESEFGYINKKGNEELFANFQEEKVHEVLQVVCESMQVRIFRGKEGRIYMISEDEGVFAINERKVRTYFSEVKALGINERSERTYLFYYVTLLLLDEFFSGNPIRLQRHWISLSNWIQIVDDAVEKHKELTLLEELELGFNFIRVGRKWKSFSTEMDYPQVMLNTKAGFLKRCIQFLSREDLILMTEEDEIRIYPKEKLVDLIERGHLRTDRLEKLMFSLHEEE